MCLNHVGGRKGFDDLVTCYIWMEGVGGDINVNISISRLQLMVDSKQRERGGLVGPHQRTLVNFLWSGLHTATATD